MAIVAADFIRNMFDSVAWWFIGIFLRGGLTILGFIVLVRVIRGLSARSHTKPNHAALPTPISPPPGLTEATDTGRDTPTPTEGAHPTQAPRGGQTHRSTEHSWPPPVTPPQ